MVTTLHKLQFQSIDKPILIPDEVYTATYVQHATWLYLGRFPKLIISFAIQDFGKYHLKILNAYYNIEKLKARPNRGGRFSAGWRSKFMFDYSSCFGTPARKDRISMCRFKNVLVEVQTKTVTHNREQRTYPDGMRYSIIDHIKGIKMP